MIRLMVTTSAYRQSSLPRPEVDAIDPDNRLLAHQSRFRLEAEQIRDNALAVSGLLVNKLGGDIVRPYQPAKYYSALNFPERDYTPSDGRRPIPPGRVHPLAAAVLAPVAAGVRCADARGMHGPAADFQHADGGARAAERSVVRRSGPGAGGEDSGECAGRRRGANSLGLAASARPRRRSRPRRTCWPSCLKKHRKQYAADAEGGRSDCHGRHFAAAEGCRSGRTGGLDVGQSRAVEFE